MIGPSDLRGLWGFPLTPFRDDVLDEGVFGSGVRALVDGGAHVIVAAGTLGQGDVMSDAERESCLRVAVETVGGRRPVLGVLDAGGDIEQAAVVLSGAGADAALLLPASGRVEDAARSLAAIEAATAGRLAVVLYQRGPLRLEPDELASLATSPILVGLKDAHGDLRAFRRLFSSLGDRLAWVCAPEDLAAAYVTHGADAVAPASMAYAPAYARSWWASLGSGDAAAAIDLLRRFAWPMTDLRYSRPDIEVTAVVEMARRFGHPVGDLRPPAAPLVPRELRELDRLAGVLHVVLDEPTAG